MQLEIAVLVGKHARGDGILGIEQRIERRALAQELLGRLVVHELRTLHGVRGDETVERGHDGQLHVFVLGGANRNHRVVVGLLGVFGKEKQPARIAGAHDVGVVAVDVDGGRNRTVCVCHDDGQAHAGGNRQLFIHVGKALRRGRREGACARLGRADACRHRRMLRFDRHELGVDLAVCHALGKPLDDGGLRGDGICAHNIRISLAKRLGDHHVAGCGNDFLFCVICHRLFRLLGIGLEDELEGTELAFLHANAAALAVVVVDTGHLAIGGEDGGVRAHDPAQHAVLAVFLRPDGALGTPAAGDVLDGIAAVHAHGANREILCLPLGEVIGIPLLAHYCCTSS